MRLGIDFGTTHTVVALVDRGNYPVVSFEHEHEQGGVLPSLIAVRESDGELRFGAQAAALSHQPGWELLRSFKRLLGEPGRTVRVAGRDFEVAFLLTRFLEHLREELVCRSNAGLREGDRLEVAVSVPANSSTGQRLLTSAAFRRAGFDVVALLNEPSAAGFEYAHRFRDTVTSKREYVLVYDLGGGTFDASLIHMEGRANEVVTSAGESQLGGDDFDTAILELVLRKVAAAAPVPGALASAAPLAHLDAKVRRALLEECRLQKEAIGPNTKRVVIDLALLGRAPLVLQVDELYESCAELVARTLQAMGAAMIDPRRAGEALPEAGGAVAWSELAGIYVVGGASNFPVVYRQLRERFGTHRVRRSPHPFGSTAIGLAIFLDEGAGYTLADRLGRHFGVFREEQDGAQVSFDVLVPKDTLLPGKGEPPLEIKRRYRAAHNLGHFRFIECGRIAEGRPEGNLALWDEVLFPFDASLRAEQDLASVPVERHQPGPNPWPEIEETYRYTAEGTLEVELRVLDDGYSSTLQIGRRGASAP